jgi:hypothetical protein
MRRDLKDAIEGMKKRNNMIEGLLGSLESLLEGNAVKAEKEAFESTKKAFGISDEELKHVLKNGGGDGCTCPACSIGDEFKKKPTLIACNDGVAFMDFGGEGVVTVEVLATKVIKLDCSLTDLKSPESLLDLLRGRIKNG